MGHTQHRPAGCCLPDQDNGDAVGDHNGQRTPGGHHGVCRWPGGQVSSRGTDEGYGIAVYLVHVLEAARCQANVRFEHFPPAKHCCRIVAHMEGEVSGSGVSECHPDAGPDFVSPPKQSKHR